MNKSLSLSLLLAFLASLSAALEMNKNIDVHAWPLTSSKSQLLASIEYNSSSATVRGLYTPTISQDERIVRVGFYQAVSNQWSGIATAADNFGPEKEKVILLHLGSDDVAYHVGFRATDKSRTQGDAISSDVQAEVVRLNPAPEVRLNKPVVLDAAGQMEKPAEKTFLQKYWWAIAGVLILQVFLSGGSDKKE